MDKARPMSSRQLIFLALVAVASFVAALVTGPMVVEALLGSPTAAPAQTAPEPPPKTGAAPHPSEAP